MKSILKYAAVSTLALTVGIGSAFAGVGIPEAGTLEELLENSPLGLDLPNGLVDPTDSETLTAAVLAVLFLGIPGQGDNGNGTSTPVPTEPNSSVDIDAEINLEKDKHVLELVAKLKVAVVFAFTVLRPDGAAESDIVAQQDNVNNTVDHDFGTDPADNLGHPLGDAGSAYALSLTAEIAESFNENTGIIQGNQDVGNMVNQANVVAAAITTAATAFSDANAALTQINLGNDVTTSVHLDADILPVLVPTKTATIIDSVSTNSGIIHVNQNAGNMNNQFNGTSLAIAIDSIVALSETDLGQWNVNNDVTETNTVKFDLIDNSVNFNSGVVNVNQSSGNMNNQATVVSFSGIATLAAPAAPFQP